MVEETTRTKEITLDEAQAVLEEQRRNRRMQCQHEINEALRRYQCNLVGDPYIQNGRIMARVRLIDVANLPGQPYAPGP